MANTRKTSNTQSQIVGVSFATENVISRIIEIKICVLLLLNNNNNTQFLIKN